VNNLSFLIRATPIPTMLTASNAHVTAIITEVNTKGSLEFLSKKYFSVNIINDISALNATHQTSNSFAASKNLLPLGFIFDDRFLRCVKRIDHSIATRLLHIVSVSADWHQHCIAHHPLKTVSGTIPLTASLHAKNYHHATRPSRFDFRHHL
jgi:hypothetical protein